MVFAQGFLLLICSSVFFNNVTGNDKAYFFVKLCIKVLSDEHVCNVLHVFIREAVYPFVGKSQRAKIEPAQAEDDILLTPIKCVRGSLLSVRLHNCNKFSRCYKTSFAIKAFW